MQKSSTKLVWFNRLLTLLVLLTGLYLVGAPFWPSLSLKIHNRNHQTFAPYGGALAKVAGTSSAPATITTPTPQPRPQENRLVVPKLLLDKEVLEGANIRTLNKGLWRLPYTSTPDKGGNTVIIGHRWTYSSTPEAFVNLDKLAVGDPIALYWQQKEYVYKVIETKVVPPSDISIEQQSEDPILTLYTCTPMWTSTNRLVVVAKLMEIN